ncbi:polysaccharide biosynthesis protein [Mucilaginibacter yixingensis]|nr:nucleoside-diphosphate sugar epimerase/dehydratase [Mucilaginibacter yixingensis]
MSFKNLLFRDRIHSKWLILLVDTLTIMSSVLISSYLVGKFNYTTFDLYYVSIYVVTMISTFLAMGIHTRIIRYANTRDMMRIVIAIMVANLAFCVACYAMVYIPMAKHFVQPIWEVFIINIFISISLLMVSRGVIRDIYSYLEEAEHKCVKENVLIYGSGQSSLLVKNAIEAQKQLMIRVCAFIDNDADKINKCIEQTHVYSAKALAALKERFGIERLLISSDDVIPTEQKCIFQQCIELGIKVSTVPPTNQWLNGQAVMSQFKDLKIEDLLGRKQITFFKDHITNEITGKRVLVTGAAGSIGSEIVRQVLQYNPQMIVLCDQAETPLHDMQLELAETMHADKTVIYIADIRNGNRIEALFNRYHPQVVFHAAAYKHVPMMENNPAEAVLTNVGGTQTLADIAIRHEVEKFIMISTDKAVRPTNVMGASKRIAEMYIQSLNYRESFVDADGYFPESTQKTKFITTRFGNVLGSNGSVIPRFKAQIEKGGPVTVTHPDITRFFMTIPEAVQLVLEAVSMGNGGEIFLFEMGKPVKIADLAANMIKLAGLVPNQDIQIVYTGLRPGEKLYEELLNHGENALPTYNKDIMVSSSIPCSYADMKQIVQELLRLCCSNNVDPIVAKMKCVLPDFVSNNSEFEKLDANFIGISAQK